jgi:hypothetical protein
VDFSLPTQRVIRSLEGIIDWRGKPSALRCDNGPEYISQDLIEWANQEFMLTLNDVTELQGMSGWNCISLRTSHTLNYWQPNGNGLTIMSDHILRLSEFRQDSYCN